LLGLLLGGIWVMVRSLWSTALRSEAEVRAFSPVPIFANVPTQPAPMGRTARLAATPIYDVLARTSDALGFAEAFRTLRTQLYDAMVPGHGRVILVTSPAPADGKTTTALALATILAADRKDVLVIDADVRKPSHHALTGHPVSPGLHELLTGRFAERDVAHAVHVTGGRFDLITAGQATPVELLSGARMHELLVRARHHYDYVVLDAPSFPLLSDALILARSSDFALSVVRLGNTTRKLAEEHVRALAGKCHGHAVVVNASDVATIYGYPEYGGSSSVMPPPRDASTPLQ
jgi:tyrosine-protein kinase Etk/Wzc